MANPQKENGYTAIANEILEALCKIRISGEARQVLDLIFRKTYGFNKKEDRIALSQFVIGTGLKKPTVCKALNKLKTLNLIIVTQKDNEDNIFKINKDYNDWIPLPKKITLPKKVKSVTKKGNSSLPKKPHTKDNTTKDKKDITTAEAVEEKPFDYQEEWNLLKNSTRKDHKIIALYWKYKGWTFENKKQISNAIRRDVRSANYLVAYNGEDVLRSMTHCQKNYEEWTLETVLSKMDDIKNKTIKPKK